MSGSQTINPILFEIIRNRLVSITEEMRVALQTVSGSPTVTEASDFFTGLFLPDGSVASMGFQVAYQAPVCGAFIKHINAKGVLVSDGDMFIGTDPYIAALHQNDVQLVGPIFADGHIIAWAGVEAHETDVGGMDFASWSPKAREVFQEGLRIPCVKLVDRGELRDDVLDMILAASRLPAQLGLDIRAFIATLNVARSRIGDLVARYDAATIVTATQRMIAVSEARMRARIAELPDGTIHAVDFLEHDGHTNVLYKVDLHLTKLGECLRLDFSGSSKQAPGFINATRAGLLGGIAGGVLPTLAYDLQWNQGALAPVDIVAPDGLICTAMFPAPVGSATVETIWVVGNVVMQALNKLLSTSPKYRYRTQASSAGAMATFNLGGVNQFGEHFGLHLMDPLAAGSGAFASKDGVAAGGPITSAMNGIADVERNEQVSPLFYFHRRLACDTGGPGRYRGGVGAEVSFTLGGIETAQALIMTHGVEVPNSAGLGGGWPGATIRQSFGRQAIRDRIPHAGDWEVFGPKPGLMAMTNRDIFAVSWQGGGGWGDPTERAPQSVLRDVVLGQVSAVAAQAVYGVVLFHGTIGEPGEDGPSIDEAATDVRRREIRRARIGRFDDDPGKLCHGPIVASLSETLLLAEDERGIHVVTTARFILATNHTRWRKAAVAVAFHDLPDDYRIRLHDRLEITCFYCPATGLQLAVDVHERGQRPADDVDLVVDTIQRSA